MHQTPWLPPRSSDPLIHQTHSHSQRWQDTLACILALLTIWFCVSVALRYGYYRDSHLVLGPSSSRLVKASSVFVKQVEVTKNEYSNHVQLYAFNKKPELSSQANWHASKFLAVAAYSREGISLWLNKGSTIHMKWEAQTRSIDMLEGIVMKGERKLEKLQPKQTIFPDAIGVRGTVYGKEAVYTVEEDDRYYIGVLNMNARNIILTMNVNVSAKVYDTTKAKNMCSTLNGSCRLSLLFPNTYYVIVMAPKSGVDSGWSVEISFVARVAAYLTLLGVAVVVIFLIMKCLGDCDGDDQNNNVIVDTYRTSNVVVAQEINETTPITRVKPNPMTYGTNEDHDEESDASSSSSEELYDEKLCIICYDEQRNCFFVPCGHCATCYDCAQRIVDGESKVCPICRRLIHKVRRLFNS